MAEKEVSCRNCSGGCCRDIQMKLTEPEVVYLRERGTELQPILDAIPGIDWGKMARSEKDSVDSRMQSWLERARNLKKGEGIYFMDGTCGNLIEKEGWLQCVAHEEPERPRICQVFQPGSDSCNKIFNARAGEVVLLTVKSKPVSPIKDNLAERLLLVALNRMSPPKQ